MAHLRTLTTQRGTELLVSGWWGRARKINYTGDWLLGLAFCLPAGFDDVVPYFYSTYFAFLLLHRAMRDDHACRAKYGADWDRYVAAVPALLIPGLF